MADSNPPTDQAAWIEVKETDDIENNFDGQAFNKVACPFEGFDRYGRKTNGVRQAIIRYFIF